MQMNSELYWSWSFLMVNTIVTQSALRCMRVESQKEKYRLLLYFGLDGLSMFSLEIWLKVEIIILPWILHNASIHTYLIIIPYFYLPLAVFIAQVLAGPSEQVKQMIQIEHNAVKNPDWLEANQLAIYTCVQGF